MEPLADQPEDRMDYDLAAPGARLGARAIDTLLGIAVYVALSLILVSTGNIEIIDEEAFYSDSAQIALLYIPPILWGLYEVLLTAKRGQTVGKRVTKIKVITAEADEPPPTRQAIMRWGILAVPMILVPTFGLIVTFGVGIWFTFDAKRQGLHDKASRTYVVNTAPPTDGFTES
jgi:uncharacterized RDD family membrane protein YckC